MAEVIVSILADEPAATVAAARRAAMAGADWIELRLDRFGEPAATLEQVIAKIALPVLASCRTPRDGGHFRGTLDERRALLGAALDAGAVGLDLEDWETWTPDRERLRLSVRSHHNFTRVPEDVGALRDGLLARGADVAKVVGMAHDLADSAPLIDLMAQSDPQAEPTVAFAMGRAASVTRILAVVLGAPYVYAAVDTGAEAAPGQLPIRVVGGLYRARELGLRTEIYGLLGDPALQSIGPWVHNRALRELGRDAVYLPFETSRPEAVLDMLPRRRLRGLSVTAPHKQSLAASCHRLAPTAERIGAVNTLTFEAHGQLVGHNTDLAGVQGALRRAGLGAVGANEHAAVLGSGGAARAAAVALADLGFEVTILARTLEPVRDFAHDEGFRLAALHAELLRRDPPRVVVHATPVGAAGSALEDQRLLPDWTPDRGCLVLDMVYRPRWTPLLRAARDAGAVAVFGIEMFLTQAAEQIALFTGQRPDEEDLRRFLAGVPDG